MKKNLSKQLSNDQQNYEQYLCLKSENHNILIDDNTNVELKRYENNYNQPLSTKNNLSNCNLNLGGRCKQIDSANFNKKGTTSQRV